MTQNRISLLVSTQTWGDIPFWVISQPNVDGFCSNMDDLKALSCWQYPFASYSDKRIQAQAKLYSNIRIIRIFAGRSTDEWNLTTHLPHGWNPLPRLPSSLFFHSSHRSSAMWPSVAQHGYYNFCHMARWEERRMEGRMEGWWFVKTQGVRVLWDKRTQNGILI